MKKIREVTTTVTSTFSYRRLFWQLFLIYNSALFRRHSECTISNFDIGHWHSRLVVGGTRNGNRTVVSSGQWSVHGHSASWHVLSELTHLQLREFSVSLYVECLFVARCLCGKQCDWRVADDLSSDDWPLTSVATNDCSFTQVTWSLKAGPAAEMDNGAVLSIGYSEHAVLMKSLKEVNHRHWPTYWQ